MIFGKRMGMQAEKTADEHRKKTLQKRDIQKNSCGSGESCAAVQRCEMGVCRRKKRKKPRLCGEKCVKKIKSVKTSIKPRC